MCLQRYAPTHNCCCQIPEPGEPRKYLALGCHVASSQEASDSLGSTDEMLTAELTALTKELTDVKMIVAVNAKMPDVHGDRLFSSPWKGGSLHDRLHNVVCILLYQFVVIMFV